MTAIPGSQWDGNRPPSPAEIREDLHPDHVDALAQQLHDLNHAPLAGTDPLRRDPRHLEVDRGCARFVLMGLHDHGWTLTRTDT